MENHILGPVQSTLGVLVDLVEALEAYFDVTNLGEAFGLCEGVL